MPVADLPVPEPLDEGTPVALALVEFDRTIHHFARYFVWIAKDVAQALLNNP